MPWIWMSTEAVMPASIWGALSRVTTAVYWVTPDMLVPILEISVTVPG